MRRPARKSVITVDEVRKAGKFFGQTSGTGNWRIAIIDPADDLNRNAANAILKILEEPPKRSLFLVLSHTPGRLLPTIRSRCLSLRLQALSPPDLDRALSHLGAAPGETDAIIRLSEGSVARACCCGTMAASRSPRHLSISSNAAASTTGNRSTSLPKRFRHGTGMLPISSSPALWSIACRQMARDAGAAGDLAEADRLARLSVELTEHFATAAAYNLDRKQTVLHVFTLFFG
jgi:DNA polymerase-3 subunit delta'